MSKREMIARELDKVPDAELDNLLAFVRALHEAHGERTAPALLSEQLLAKDWLTPEEDAAWADL